MTLMTWTCPPGRIFAVMPSTKQATRPAPNDRFQLSLNASALHLAVALGGATRTVRHYWH